MFYIFPVYALEKGMVFNLLATKTTDSFLEIFI